MLGHYIFDPHNRSYVLCIVFVIKPRGRLPELGNPKSGRGRLRKRFITSLSHRSNGVSQKVVVTRAGRL